MVLSGPPTATLPPIWLSMVTAPVGTAQLVSPMSRCAVAVPDVFVFISETAEERRTATRVEFPGELDWAAAMLTTRPPTPTEPTQVPPGRAVQIGKNAPPLNETSASNRQKRREPARRTSGRPARKRARVGAWPHPFLIGSVKRSRGNVSGKCSAQGLLRPFPSREKPQSK